MTTALTKRRAAKRFPLAVVQELDQLERDLGGRQALVGLLSLAPLTDDLRYIIGLLAQPHRPNEARALAEICAQGNILPGELLKHLGAAALLRGKTLALQHIGNGIANVAQDVMRRAAPYEESCHVCGGAGGRTPDPTPTVPNPVSVPCTTCLGTGRLRFEPELDRQKVAIDMAGLLPKSSGVQILNANVQGGSTGAGEGALERLQGLVDKTLYGQDAAEIVDAEPIPDEDAAVVPDPAAPAS